jgi:NAD(P)-dependent dehydrogenase (short-subunit alcohol dehydrogenase family)
MTGGLAGKIAVVTGAGRGIGRAFALALGRAGCRVAAADVDLAGAEATARLVQASEGEAIGLKVSKGTAGAS